MDSRFACRRALVRRARDACALTLAACALIAAVSAAATPTTREVSIGARRARTGAIVAACAAAACAAATRALDRVGARARFVGPGSQDARRDGRGRGGG
jgi:hypothetical protein